MVPRDAGPRGAARASHTFPATRAAIAFTAAALLASGCGEGARQDAHEPKTSFPIKVLLAAFPAKQSIAKRTRLILRLRNTGAKTAPNIAVTLDSLNYAENFPELAAAQRPVWVIERGPGAISRRPIKTVVVAPAGGGVTNYVNTWALGPLAPGHVRTFSWLVVPVKSGLHIVHYVVAAGLGGNAKAVSATGGPVRGTFTVLIAPAPPATQVNPNTGKVVPGTYPGP